jgi:hypothetical protein
LFNKNLKVKAKAPAQKQPTSVKEVFSQKVNEKIGNFMYNDGMLHQNSRSQIGLLRDQRYQKDLEKAQTLEIWHT